MIERKLVDELESFLSTAERFRPEEVCRSPVIHRCTLYTVLYSPFRQSYHDYPNLSVLDYVAGREFETAEEADEWLSCVSVQKNQDFEEESHEVICMNRFWSGKFIDASMQYDARHLHCACWWGNIFGVEWLVEHGANVNVQDRV